MGRVWEHATGRIFVMSGSFERAGGVAFAPLAAAWDYVDRQARSGAAVPGGGSSAAKTADVLGRPA